MLAKYLDMFFRPAHGCGRMLVENELASSDLSTIHATTELQVHPSFGQLLSYRICIHLLVVQSIAPDVEYGTWRRSQHPVRVKVIDQFESFVPV